MEQYKYFMKDTNSLLEQCKYFVIDENTSLYTKKEILNSLLPFRDWIQSDQDRPDYIVLCKVNIGPDFWNYIIFDENTTMERLYDFNTQYLGLFKSEDCCYNCNENCNECLFKDL